MTETANEQIADTLEKTPFISELVKNQLILKLASTLIMIVIGLVFLKIARKLIDKLIESDRSGKIANKSKIKTAGNLLYSCLLYTSDAADDTR